MVGGHRHGSRTVRKSVYCHGPVQMAEGRVTSVPLGTAIGKILSLIMVVILAGAMTISGMTKESKADDNWFVNVICGYDLGLNTSWQPRAPFGKPDPNEDSGYNKLTMQDVYGGKLGWTTFNGTREPSNIKKRDGNDPHRNILSVGGTANNNGVINRMDTDIFSGADDVHDFSCPVRGVVTMFAGTILGIGDMVSDFTSLFVSSAVDPNFICDDPANPEGVCINLLAVIAGKGNTGSDGGIIGRLFDGMYTGLIVMVFAAVGVWAAWTGLIKRKLTSALSGIAWGVAIFGVGVFFMSQPLLLAKLPMQIGTSLGGCVVMGMNGKNCMSSSDGSPNKDSSNTECYVDTNGTMPLTRAMALNAKMASCKVWKAFVWEPWVAGQFGVSYNELFTGGGGGDAGPLFQNSKTKDNLEYWKNIKVGLYTPDKTMSQMCVATRDGSDQGYSYSNVALYQANLQAEPAIHACGTPYHQATNIKTDEQTYGDWVWIIDAMTQARSTKDQSGADNLSIMWASWTGNNYLGRIQVAFIAMFSALMGAAVLITTAVLAMVYLFMSVLLTAFAPLFFLMGVMPGQGKKLFLGWVEKVVSNTLKYFGCILWMMVTLELYAAVLGNINSNIGMTFIFTIIVTLAMWLYRGEFLKMIGKANFGGTQFSNSMGDWVKKKGKSAADTALATGAGYVGGLVAGRSAPKEKLNRHRYKAGETVNGKTLSQDDADKMNEARKAENAEKRKRNKLHSRRAGARDGAMYQLNQSMKGKGGILGQAAIVNDRIRDDRRNRNRKRAEDQRKQKLQAFNNLMTQTEGLGVVESEQLKDVVKNAFSEKDLIEKLHDTKGYQDAEARVKSLEGSYAGRGGIDNAIQSDAAAVEAAQMKVDKLRQGAVGTSLAYNEFMNDLNKVSTSKMDEKDRAREAKRLSTQFNQMMMADSNFAAAVTSGSGVTADDIQKMAMNDTSVSSAAISQLSGLKSTFDTAAQSEFSANGATYYGLNGSADYTDLVTEDAKASAALNTSQQNLEQDLRDMRDIANLNDSMRATESNAISAFNFEQGTKALDERAETLNVQRLGWGANSKQVGNMNAADETMSRVTYVDENGDVQINTNAVNATFGGGSYAAIPTPTTPGVTSYGINDEIDVHELAAGTARFDHTGGNVGIDTSKLSGDRGNRGTSLK